MPDPITITLPPVLSALFVELVDRFTEAHGGDPAANRRLLETAVLQRGIREVEKELDEARPVAKPATKAKRKAKVA